MALTDREERMLLTIFEKEADEARAIEARWRVENPETYEEGKESLDYEVAFAAGAAMGAHHAWKTLESVINWA